MARRRNNLDPDEDDPDELQERLRELGEENDDAVLADGAVLRVPLYLRDGSINPRLTPTQRAKAAQQTEDARARSFGLSDASLLHRPGFRRCQDSLALARVQQAYNDRDLADAAAYKPGESKTEGAICTVQNVEYPLDYGSPGHIRNGICVPDKPRRRDAAIDARAEAYRLYDEEQANAWRGPKR